ncbi:MAG: HEAT repeat domain-containing protein [Candidatus Nitrosopolaris sp.]
MSRIRHGQGHSQSADRMNILLEMERQFDHRNAKYFLDLLTHTDNVIRTRAICILADIADKDSVDHISNVLKNDKDPLVRHEAAFSLGQLGFTNAISALSGALSSDSSFFVRHEAAIALGVIGSESAREALDKALDDGSEEVRESANIALANIDYISKMKRTNKFSKMTGG